MFDPEQEHWDHEAGCATEQQNALSMSRMETQLRDPLIDNALMNGKFVLVRTYPAHCSMTDAIFGQHEDFISEHDTRPEAAVELVGYDDQLGEDDDIHIEPRMQVAIEPRADDEELPPF